MASLLSVVLDNVELSLLFVFSQRGWLLGWFVVVEAAASLLFAATHVPFLLPLPTHSHSTTCIETTAFGCAPLNQIIIWPFSHHLQLNWNFNFVYTGNRARTSWGGWWMDGWIDRSPVWLCAYPFIALISKFADTTVHNDRVAIPRTMNNLYTRSWSFLFFRREKIPRKEWNWLWFSNKRAITIITRWYSRNQSTNSCQRRKLLGGNSPTAGVGNSSVGQDSGSGSGHGS